MAEDTFNKDRPYGTENHRDVEKRGASEKPLGRQIPMDEQKASRKFPMNEQKTSGANPETNPHSQASKSNQGS